MSDTASLKERVQGGGDVNVMSATVDTTREALQEMADRDAPDLLFVDGQHQPLHEVKLRDFCQIANEIGVAVMLRLKHTRHAYLSGNFLDLGVMGVLVPQVETEATVDEAIDAFYYPPFGKRSWGPSSGYGFDGSRDRLQYAEWWNKTGILALQIESLNTVTKARQLAKPGIDMLMFGANDLNFDLETYANPPLTSVAACIEHVKKEMAGTKVKVAAGLTPMGSF